MKIYPLMTTLLLISSAAQAGFDGFRTSIGGTYDFNFSSPTLKTPSSNVNLPSASFGKVYVDFGYTKVLLGNVPVMSPFIGASVVGGWDFFKLDSKDKGTPPLAQNQSFNGGLYAGLKVNGGFTLSPNIAIKVIGEVDTQRFTFQSATSESLWTYSGTSFGLGMDFSFLGIIVGIGAKLKSPAKDMTFPDNQKVELSFKTIETFIEIGF
jgi:hypothetical protein